MKYSIILISVFFSLSYQAQDYIPFPDSLATWNFYESGYFGELDEFFYQGFLYHIEGDTMVDDLLYSKLFASSSYDLIDGVFVAGNVSYVLVGGIREDSAKKIWYKNFNFENWDTSPWFLFSGSGSYFSANYLSEFHPETGAPRTDLFTDSTEVMLYDFGMEIGDSIKFYGDVINETSYWSVLEEINVDILGRRNFIFSLPEDEGAWEEFSRVWIEGIGDSKADLFSLHDIVRWEGFGEGYEKRLTCFLENGEQVYTPNTFQGPSNLTQNCEGILVGINELEKKTLEIYPNPSGGIFTITLPSLEPSTLSIYNSLGSTVYHQKEILGGRYNFDLTHFPKGIYLVLLETGKGSYLEKVVKE